MKITRVTFIPIILLALGCATVDRAKSFQEVQTLTATKLSAQLVRNQDQKSAEEIESAVNKLLSEKLSVSDAVQLALLNSPTIQAVYEDVGIAQADLVQAGLLQNPIFDIGRRFPGKAFEFDITKDFIDIFFIPLRTKVASNVYESTKLKVASAVIEHAAKTKMAYYELQCSLQKLKMYQTISQVMDAKAFVADKLYNVGNINVLALRNEQKHANKAKIILSLAENKIIHDREDLNVLLGLWRQNINWQIEESLTEPIEKEPKASGLEKFAISERFDLAAELKEIDALGNNINLSGYSAVLTEAVVNFHTEAEPDGAITRGPSIQLPIPIFNQGGAQKAKAFAIFRQKAAHFMQHAVEVRSDVRRAFTKMRAAKQRVQYYETQVIPQQTKILEQTQLQYNGMFKSVFELLQTKRAQVESHKELTEILKEYWIARTELELAVGGRINTELT